MHSRKKAAKLFGRAIIKLAGRNYNEGVLKGDGEVCAVAQQSNSNKKGRQDTDRQTVRTGRKRSTKLNSR